ncbi:hypothetical protein D039_2310 [Vibrio parahaemolyticus EKP-028]|nr:hypothetical protein D039_2310 [Vibrio parahaemolyticus EKP-028]
MVTFRKQYKPAVTLPMCLLINECVGLVEVPRLNVQSDTFTYRISYRLTR